MANPFRHVVASLVAITVTAGIAATAQAAPLRQYAQQRYAEGSQMWAQDGWCYAVQGGRWVRTGYFRRFPDPRNYPGVFDLYQNGRFVQRVGASAPRTTAPATRQPSNDEIRLQQLVNQLNQLTAGGGGRVVPGAPGTIGGFSSSGSFLPGSTVNVGGARTAGEVIAGQTGANWRTPFLDPNCAGSYRGC